MEGVAARHRLHLLEKVLSEAISLSYNTPASFGELKERIESQATKEEKGVLLKVLEQCSEVQDLEEL